MLDVSRIENGKLQYRFEKLNLTKITADMAEQNLNVLFGANCKLEMNLKESVFVNGDRQRLEQVIVNLLTNAAKYGAGKPVNVQVSLTSGNLAQLTVKDNGIGISPENQPKIFERFERVSPEYGVSGLGLGLYITRQIVLAHKGEITVESQAGAGSAFIVSLPAEISPCIGEWAPLE